ncbi:MAG: transglycosylase SLT domain-containing protein, partial [Legionellaceae bacterium]|nr:transglycosylase SLT domain-containing protein [Legionellaceae bacterium]
YKPPHLQDAQLLLSIEQQPTRIRSLDKKGIHSEFYLFGLHKLIFKNMPLAIQYWQKAQLNDSQNQAFISYVALHKAVHNQPDASQWFAKLRPAYYNDDLIEWRIRDALKQHRWEDVRRLSQLNSHKDEAIWQYWLARALDAQGHTLEAKKIYTNLASHKNYYYGFLASMRLHQPWKVNQQTLPIQTQHIRAYKPITDTIKQLYLKHDTRQANQLLQDFISELPSNEKAAILYWVLTDLKWYGKAVTLSDNDDLRAYTSLRFPLLYRSWIQKMAKQYQLSPAFIYAVIRQESGFYETIGSSAGAQGIMQIMPDTAKMISRFAHIPYRNAAELSSYDKNIQMGTAYLHHLAILFNQQPVLMLAAYNAGPRQVHRWLAHNEQQEVDIWIESIPWRETRNYIKNIVMFYLIYQDILKEPTNYPRLLKPVEG